MIGSVRQAVTDWFFAKGTKDVDFLETTLPEYDPYARYTMDYEVVFEPASLKQARVEVWVTTDGHIGIGFEQRERIAKLLGISNYRVGFAAGYEPIPMSIEGLIANLENIANGNIAVAAPVFPLFGLGKTKAVMLDKTFESLREQDENVKYWLHPVKRFQSNYIVRVLSFSPW